MRISAQRLARAVAEGADTIGQIRILPERDGDAYWLCHLDDADRPAEELAVLETVRDPAEARRLSTFAADGSYRFAKSELSLQSGWLMKLADAEELLDALNGFYPAAVGVWLAHRDDRLHVQHLRDKLNRQTGMYRNAKHLSDAGAQALVRSVCGPGNRCVKRILWRISENVPLEDSEASRFPGHLAPSAERAIPLLCEEACNHFVAETRKAAKAEAAGK